jgi:hypothetical protein
MKRCRHFGIQELVSRDVFQKHGQNAWRFIDPYAIEGLDFLREHYGYCEINTWVWGRNFEFSGLRANNEYNTSGPLSAHRHGKAFDLKFRDVAPEVVQREINEGIVVVPQLTELGLGSTGFTHVAFSTNVKPIFTYRY